MSVTANQSVITRPLETPLVAQDVQEECGLLGQPPPVQPVVGRHDGECSALADRHLERNEIELAQRALVNDRTDGRALELGVIADEMLDGGEHAFGLDAPHVPGGKTARQQRVLGVALEVPAGQRRPVQVDRRSEQPPAAPIACFPPDERAECLDESRVPRGAERGAARDAGGGGAPHSGQGISPCAVRTVGHVHLGNAEPVHGNRGQHVLSRSESGLLLKCQRVNQRFDIRQFTAPVLAL